jgi:Tol biopolymer transport system component
LTRVLTFLAVAVLVTRQGGAQATPEVFLNINPSWSPDGRQLVFESSRHGNNELYVINADGTGERRLTYSPSNVENSHASWSPDGSSIVFDSFRGGAFHLYVIRPDGSGERQLTHGDAAGVEEFARHPEWSPDGRLIAFDSRRDGNGEYYVIQPDGSALRRLTNTPDAHESHPAWTPDGEVILSAVAGETRTLSGLDPATGRTRRLFETSVSRSRITISPDRRRYFFRSSTDSTPRLHIGTVDGAPSVAITPRGNTSYEAAWSPDGSRVAFYYDIGGAHQLFVVDADGRNLRQLTRTAVP